ncbi:MAG: SH3 domain-containing protein [Eubacteriales bacterium]|nr:SH3 domain-containing protein [Eubacteriales bacterium]
MEDKKQRWRKRIRVLYQLAAAFCLFMVFPGTWKSMENHGLLQMKTEQGRETKIDPKCGTLCTKKSNALDGVPLFAEAGSTLQTGLIPEGKCCQLLGEVKVKGKKWMKVSYCGITGWLMKKRVNYLSQNACYIVPGTIVYMNSITEKGIVGYKEPLASSEIVKNHILYGEEFSIKELKNGWGKTEKDGRVFWISMFHMGSYPTKYWKVQTLSRAGEINLRQGAGEHEKALCKIPENTKLVITQFQSGWGKVNYEGLEGWVMLHYLTPIAEETFD